MENYILSWQKTWDNSFSSEVRAKILKREKDRGRWVCVDSDNLVIEFLNTLIQINTTKFFLLGLMYTFREHYYG